ncbi:DUF2946 domain-containing protein [Duganella sp. FT50W]|uniref:DUF2946 domain-containing protein n=1 Tax=Duganella lactea TaxID=2692173 RepID=A0A6L8MFB1_9BURK|nr:DUF2946 domain-containing protein [Duganella lactea]MYM81637.1 DUF2946 domain-containing protein [Duganella lactea]
MINLAKRKTLYLWIAMLAMLFGALAPTVSHALAAGAQVDAALMLCTANGYKIVKPSGGDGQAPLDAKSLQHCAFCPLHGGADALPASPAVALAPSAGRAPYPPLFYRAPRAQHIWSAAQQRAPPFLA